jgi:hypothetical protein
MTASNVRPAPAAPAEQPITYQSRRGGTHHVLLGVDSNGVWVVYDIASGGEGARRGLLVDRLLGDQEKASEAHALAVDYAACQSAFAAGHRDELPNPNPLPRATRVPQAVIARHARAATRRSAADARCAEASPPAGARPVHRRQPSRTGVPVAA